MPTNMKPLMTFGGLHLMMSYSWWMTTIDDGTWWGIDNMIGDHLMVGRLFWSSPNDVALWLHYYMMTLLMHHATWMLHSYIMTLWSYDDIDNNEEATLSQTFLMLSQNFYALNLRMITNKNYFGHLGGILWKWILEHLKEDFFPLSNKPLFAPKLPIVCEILKF